MQELKKTFTKPEADVIEFSKSIDTITQSITGNAGGSPMDEGDEN